LKEKGDKYIEVISGERGGVSHTAPKPFNCVVSQKSRNKKKVLNQMMSETSISTKSLFSSKKTSIGGGAADCSNPQGLLTTSKTISDDYHQAFNPSLKHAFTVQPSPNSHQYQQGLPKLINSKSEPVCFNVKKSDFLDRV
jgi:hypothetical protein